MTTTTTPATVPTIRFSSYGDPIGATCTLQDLIDQSRRDGMLYARAEDSGCEGCYCEVCIWNDEARRFERFAFVKLFGGEFEIATGECAGERESAEYCARLINEASTAWNNARLPIIHRMPTYEPTTADEVRTRNPSRVLEVLRRVTRLAEKLDAQATRQGRGYCNGHYAGNVCTEGCPLCEAGQLLELIDQKAKT